MTKPAGANPTLNYRTGLQTSTSPAVLRAEQDMIAQSVPPFRFRSPTPASSPRALPFNACPSNAPCRGVTATPLAGRELKPHNR